jgi:peptide/nickel transport system ATP-binding protein
MSRYNSFILLQNFDMPPVDGQRRDMLRVHDLRVRFPSAGGDFAAVDGISFELGRGESLALIGESGSGKSTAALALPRLLPRGAHVSGRVELFGEDLLAVPEKSMRHVRGAKIAMVFHDPFAALNPVLRVGTQIGEALRAHAGLGRRAAAAATLDLLLRVGLAAEVAHRYAHQLSGGMRQRALIAMALACAPAIVVLDEPTSSLDAVTQRQMVALLRQLRRERQFALLLATHDLDLAADLCDRVAVLYAGRIVEHGAPAAVFSAPRHPYTAGLLRSLPPPLGDRTRVRLSPVPGSAPVPWARPTGCSFRDRCPRAMPDCSGSEPELTGSADGAVACFHPVEVR